MRKSSGRATGLRAWLLLLFAVLVSCFRARADSVTNFPVADTSLIEVSPDHNNGGQAWVLSGRTQNGPHVRALYRFDFTNFPPGAVIQSAVLQLEVLREPDKSVNSSFSLHRMLRPWGEGTNVATTNPGQGTPATPGGATWNHSYFPTNAWTEPGGAAGIDYLSESSSFQFVYGPELSPYRFENTPEMIADVQEWVSHPENNFGWMLIGESDAIFTARQFNSRESLNSKPALEVTFVAPPRIDRVEKLGNQIQLSIIGQPGLNHTLEYHHILGGSGWHVLTNVGLITEATNVLVTDLITSTQRFYRVEAH